MSEETSLAVETEAANTAAVEANVAAETEAKSWMDNIQDPEIKSYVEKTGYKSFDDVAAAARSGRQLVSKIQGDPDRVAMIPKDWDDPAQVAEFYGKLGRPETVDGYEFKDSEGNPIADPVVDWFKEQAFNNGLSPEKAGGMLQGFQEMAAQLSEQQEQQAQQEWENSIKQDQEALRREWGNGHEAKLAAARSALQAFPELNNADLERSMGVANYYKLMASLGEKVGEHGTVATGSSSNSFGKTPDQAKQELQELTMSDEFKAAFSDSSHPGHQAALAKRERLMKDAYPS